MIKKLIDQYVEQAVYNLMCYSQNYLADAPKAEFEKEWMDVKQELTLLKQLQQFLPILEMVESAKLEVAQYDRGQLLELLLGLDEGIDISQYDNVNFDRFQMKEIRFGLEDGLEVGRYADVHFNAEQMEQVRVGLQRGIDVSSFGQYDKPWYEMSSERQEIEDYLLANGYDGEER